MARIGFYFNMTACIGCKTCQVACKDKNDLDVGTIFRKVSTFETGAFPKPGVFHISMACNHCADPKCVEGCPTGAMHIAEDGTVQHNKDLCIGCQYCVWNCPYDVPQYIESIGKVGKCDLCKDLIDKGENPACVDACVMRCIEWGDLDELAKKHAGEELVSDLPILPGSNTTKPSVLINPKTVAKQKDFRAKEV